MDNMAYSQLLNTTAATYQTAALNGIFGGIVGGQQQALGNYSSLQSQYHNVYSTNTLAYEFPKPIQKALKKAKGFIAELREEIEDWHGDILTA